MTHERSCLVCVNIYIALSHEGLLYSIQRYTGDLAITVEQLLVEPPLLVSEVAEVDYFAFLPPVEDSSKISYIGSDSHLTIYLSAITAPPRPIDIFWGEGLLIERFGARAPLELIVRTIIALCENRLRSRSCFVLQMK